MKKKRVTRKITIAMLAKHLDITSQAVYQWDSEKKEKALNEYKKSIKDGTTPDPREQ